MNGANAGPSRIIDVDIAVVRRGPRVLVCQRLPTAPFPDYFEFPGGKREAGESPLDCLARELREEVAIEVAVVASLSPIEHEYPHGHIRLHAHICDHVHGEPQPLGCQQAIWVPSDELWGFQFPPASLTIINQAMPWLEAAGID